MSRESDRERLRQTFDAIAGDYQEARPEYPDSLYEALLALTGVRPETDALCEVGCASGKATLPLARRGFAITCVELGAALAAEARRNLAPFPRVKVDNAPFETWSPASGEPPFGLVYAATAWHWIDPAAKYQRAADLLRPGGHLAFWEGFHVHPADVDPFFSELQPVYEEIGSGGWAPLTLEDLPSLSAEVGGTGLFDEPTVRRFQWEVRYTADSYIRLIDTFSSNLVMEPWQRERLNGEVRRLLAARPSGVVRRHWGAALHVARRR